MANVYRYLQSNDLHPTPIDPWRVMLVPTGVRCKKLMVVVMHSRKPSYNRTL